MRQFRSLKFCDIVYNQARARHGRGGPCPCPQGRRSRGRGKPPRRRPVATTVGPGPDPLPQRPTSESNSSPLPATPCCRGQRQFSRIVFRVGKQFIARYWSKSSSRLRLRVGGLGLAVTAGQRGIRLSLKSEPPARPASLSHQPAITICLCTNRYTAIS